MTHQEGKTVTLLGGMVALIIFAFVAWALGDIDLYAYLAPVAVVVVIGVTAWLTLKP